ncbi:17-beta-hydroxysteroid dehydrogenase type 6-like [Uloborus diversus]|uniref:17-beta-hydroxysteroid dehydrogenase type 6-like n=1 Tax=Uloborus diversus TaxID=327109 RepID=UPI00240A8A5E|nr:17-beta-hydroxysteroid dehydrogenase type 6-like [Uloborus diversus]
MNSRAVKKQSEQYLPNNTAADMERQNIVMFIHLFCLAAILKLLHYLLPECIVSYYLCAANWLLFLNLAVFSFEFLKQWYFVETVPTTNKAVLITGCDSGFGHHLARRLDSKGFQVFATCLLPKGVGSMELQRTCSKNLKIIPLDVTKDDSVNSAVESVKKHLGTSIFWALVNNAGVYKGFCLDMSTVEDVRANMEVNALGLVRVTKAFLPLLRQSKGRIVNVTSLGGKLSNAFLMPYCMSKFAAVAFTECIAYELKHWGIKAISVEPEAFRTPLIAYENRFAEIEDSLCNLPDDIRHTLGNQYQKRLEALCYLYWKSSTVKLDAVLNDLEAAVCLKYPSSVYKPSRNFFVKMIIYVFERLPMGILSSIFDFYLWALIPPLKGK